MDALPPGLAPPLRRRAELAAGVVAEHRARTWTVVHHIDADGVSSGAIAKTALARAGIAHRLLAVKSLDEHHLRIVEESRPEALWFCDLGSTTHGRFTGLPKVVCDHHQLVRDGNEEFAGHVNPLLDGLDGGEISGAGCALLVALAFDARNVDLLPMALVGAAADLQDRRERRFVGANSAILEHGKLLGLVEERQDLTWYGCETRPLRKFLTLATDPEIPTVSRDGRGVERMFADLGIPLQADGRERTWSRLDDDERRAVRSRLVEIFLDCGLGERIERLFRQVVNFTEEPRGSPTREPQEFGTLLNSTARYGRPEIGLAVAAGDRGAAFQESLGLLLDHRRHLAGALDAFARSAIHEATGLQWLHLRDQVRDTVIGIVCGMALDSLGLRRDLVLVGLAWTPDGRTKISARAPHELGGRVDLSVALREAAAAAVGGQGGGHPGAAGATIPRACEAEFVRALDERLAAQLGVVALSAPQTFRRSKQSRL